MRTSFLWLLGISYGALSAAGVFTVFVAVGLVPRFAGKTHTANKILVYEEMVVFGTIVGCIASIFRDELPRVVWAPLPGILFQVIYGVFSGIFVGCLALAIAEMLDSIPIFSRRISLRHGLGLAILSMAAGKFLGSLFYFFYGV